ncbi:MAG: N-acetyltransferase [Pedosphaera sp.]|nr:N-acetyltransferase [Pedosphaera sp.]
MKSGLLADLEVFQQFAVPTPVTIRTCTAGDLPNLEWFGMFAAHREIIQAAYERQEQGENVMLVADVHGWAVGQLWIDLAKKVEQSTGILWALRVFPFLRNLRIGTRLIKVAEQVLRDRGFDCAEIGAEKDDPAARRLYERLGYRLVGSERSEYSYTGPDGVPVHVPVDEWILHKRLVRGRTGRTPVKEMCLAKLQEEH